MELYLDDTPVTQAVSATGTLEETLRHVQQRLCRDGRLVVGLRCDGVPVPAGQMATTLREPTARFRRLDIATSTRGALVSEAMGQADGALEKTSADCGRIAEMLIAGRTAEAVESLRECLGLWQQIHETLGRSLEMLELDPQNLTIQNLPFLELIARPKVVLLQVKQALLAQDYVLLADLLRYEFEDVMTGWQSTIRRFQQEADEWTANHPAI